MTHNVHAFVFPFAFALLPGAMDSPEARAMLLAVGLQESKFEDRRQKGNGPAHGFWQFEKGGGIHGVMTHKATAHHVVHVCEELRYLPPRETGIYEAIINNDVLACCLARLLLWTLPSMLPRRDEAERAWLQYLAAWRPGKPRHDDWPANFSAAWQIIDGHS